LGEENGLMARGPLLIGIGGTVAALVAYFVWKRGQTAAGPVQAGASAGDVGEVQPVSETEKPKSGIGNQYDALISSVANAESVDPVLLKAIVATETDFDEEAVNPEQSFTLNGVSYSPSDGRGRKALRDFIAAGGDPASIGLNPSLGLAQVRVGNGKHFIPGLQALELFDPQTNLTASSRLLRELVHAGVTLETIDAYNVGQGRVLSGELRNLPYRDKAKRNYAIFQTDF